MLTTVTLHGALAEVAGAAQWVLDVMSPGEALRAIECQCGKLFAHLLAKDEEGVRYRVWIEGEDVAGDFEVLRNPVRHYASIDFIPVPAGAGAGLWEAIAGVLLIVAGVVIAIASEGSLAYLSTALITAGIGLLAGGVIQMFFGPKPPVVAGHSSRDREREDASASYLFSGPVNTVGQGGAVPILYGRMIVGGQTISSGIRTTSTKLKGETQEEAEEDEAKRAAVLGITAGLVDRVDKSDGDKIRAVEEQENDGDEE